MLLIYWLTLKISWLAACVLAAWVAPYKYLKKSTEKKVHGPDLLTLYTRTRISFSVKRPLSAFNEEAKCEFWDWKLGTLLFFVAGLIGCVLFLFHSTKFWRIFKKVLQMLRFALWSWMLNLMLKNVFWLWDLWLLEHLFIWIERMCHWDGWMSQNCAKTLGPSWNSSAGGWMWLD